MHGFLMFIFSSLYVQVLFNETLLVVWINIIVPFSVLEDITKKVGHLVDFLNWSLLSSDKEIDVNDAVIMNTCDYLFLSNALAKKVNTFFSCRRRCLLTFLLFIVLLFFQYQYPDLIESKIVLQYRTFLPGDLGNYLKEKSFSKGVKFRGNSLLLHSNIVNSIFLQFVFRTYIAPKNCQFLLFSIWTSRR
jgi:hypothetical protein